MQRHRWHAIACSRNLQIAIFWVFLAMVLSWASFAVVYQFTDKVQNNLRFYNEEPIAVIEPLTAHRGSATWFVLAAAVRGACLAWS